MAIGITTQQQTQISQLYVALFGRAPANSGLGYWAQELVAGTSLTQVANEMFATDPARAYYPAADTNAQIIDSFFFNVLGRHPATDGLNYWVGKLNLPTASVGSVINDMIASVTNYVAGSNPDPTIDALGVTSAALFANKSAVALHFALSTGSVALANVALVGVTADPASVLTVEAANDAAIAASTAVTYTLTTGPDHGAAFTGTSLADIFTSNVEQNSLGQQVNTLGSGDILNGGGGVDTLNAKITAGAFVGGSLSMPIQPETNSIEHVNLQAVNSTIGSPVTDITITNNPNGAPIDLIGLNTTTTQSIHYTNTEVFVNAKDMLGVTEISSLHSDANLVIQNLTTQDNSGAARPVSDMTIGMKYAGNADHMWNASDLSVYFDQDYLTTQTTYTKPSVDFKLMNEDAYDQTINSIGGVRPLDGVYIFQMDIHLNGVKYSLAPYIWSTESTLGDGSQISTYAQQLAAVQLAIVALKADHPTDLALQSLTAANDGAFTSDISPITGLLRSGTTLTMSVDGSTGGVANTLTVANTDLQLVRSPGAAVDNNNRYERADITPSNTGTILEINVALEKVGNAGEGGNLIIGSMNKTADNSWDAVRTTTNTISGIEQFNVTVYGANDKSSSLASLASTNNNLKVVNVVTDAAQTGTYADLTIGNSNTDTPTPHSDTPNADDAASLKDVQTFDASGLKGDLHLHAALTSEVTAKYLNVVDFAANPAADNVAFTYTGGSGNDYMNLYMDPSNLAQPGTATREDMTLVISGGLGNDEITTLIGTGVEGQGPSGGGSNWYLNQHINANDKIGLGNSVATGQLQLNGNEGNDTIRNMMTGDYAINGGTGDDTVYSDNSGSTSAWVVNAVTGSTDTADLQSKPAVAAQTGIANLKLNVSFKGFEAHAVVGGATAGSITGVSVTDLTINQAIKDAINNDAVLNKLLIAEDGPARTLVITSLIDGAQISPDAVGITLTSTALTVGQGLISGLHLITNTQAGLLGFGGAIGLVNSGFADIQDASSGVGSNSYQTSDSLIVGGTGNDVIVLSTGAYSNEGVGYAGLGNGTDSIVNFSNIVNVVTGPFDTTSVSIAQGANATTGTAAVAEVFNLNLTGTAGAAPGAIAFSDAYFGTTSFSLSPTPGESAAAIATALIAGFNAEAGSVWTASAGSTAGSVVFTAQTAGAGSTIPTIANTGAQITYDASGVGVTDVLTTPGAAAVGPTGATTEVVTVTFADATLAATYTFDGVSVSVLAGETGANIAAAFDSVAAGGLPGWTHTNAANSPNLVLTSTTPGALTDLTNAAFAGANFMVTTPTPSTTGQDYLDFTSYGAKAVYVGATLVTGAPAALGEHYIVLTESGTNAGSYTMTEYTEAGIVDTTVGFIGVADFGAHQNFVPTNFVIV